MIKALIVGCGIKHRKAPGQTTLDIIKASCVDIVHDLNIFPWPFEDNSFTRIAARHVVEHLNSLIDFMNEAWRILTPGGTILIETPLAGGDVDLEWADPTHKRCYRIHSFINYFTPEGVDKFGYTDKPWNFIVSKVVDSVVVIHAIPIKMCDCYGKSSNNIGNLS